MEPEAILPVVASPAPRLPAPASDSWTRCLKIWLHRFDRLFARPADNPVGEEDLEVYAAALGDLSQAELNQACYFALQELGPFWPSPREIRECLSRHPVPRPPRPDCVQCGSTGWVQVAGTRTVKKCSCLQSSPVTLIPTGA